MTTTKMPPWLEELSDDWPSESSSLTSNTSRRPGKYQFSAEKTRKPGSLKPEKHRSSRTILGDHNGNAVFFNQGVVHISSERDCGRELWGVGMQSPHLTINDGTVQQKTPRASPTKPNEVVNVPEWKKRLVHGEMAYGEQKDLFSPIGLENIFQQVNRVKEQTMRPKFKGHKSPTNQKSLFKEESSYSNTSSQICARRKSRNVDRQRRLSQPSELGDLSSAIDTQNCDQGNEHPIDDKEFSRERRFVSGQTELNEEFSPVFISKQSTVSGKFNYAAYGSYRNHKEQKVSETTDSQNFSLRLQNEKPGCDKSQVSMLSEDLSMGTPDIAELGDFVTCKRGGYSVESSFQNRSLSPSPVRRKRSQIHNTYKSHLLTISSTETRGVPFPPKASESHRSTPPPKEYSAQVSNSPLKLFGNHDTFTNHQLLRRMGQLQDPDDLILSNDQSEHTISAGLPLSPAIERNKSLAALAIGEPSIYDNNTESHMKSSNVPIPQTSSLESRELREAECLISTPPEMKKKPQSPIESDRSPYSSIVPSVSISDCIAFSAPNLSHNLNKFNYAEDPRWTTHTYTIDTSNKGSSHLHLRKAYEASASADGKRPQSSPTKSPTPKRRRTLLQLETPKQNVKESEAQGNEKLDPCSRNTQNGESSFGDEVNNACLDEISRRQSPQPLNRTSDQWRKQRKPTDEFLCQGLKSELEPISEYGEFQATPQKLYLWNPHEVAIDSRHACSNTQTDTRKHSLTTQDYIDEAMKIMSWIRSNRPKSGLASLGEAEGEQFDESMGSEASMTLSRPPSREGRTTKWRDPNSHKPQSKVSSHLQKYREDDNDNIVLSSLEALRINDSPQGLEASQSSSDTIRITHNSSFIDKEPKEGIVEVSNAPDALNTHNSDHSDKFSSGRTNITEGSRRSENVTTFAPDAVAHLIPKEIAGMTFDKEKGMWVRVQNSPKRKDAENRDLSATESDDDPLEKIPDLLVNEEEHGDGATLGQSCYTAQLRGMLQKNVQFDSKTILESKNNEIDNDPQINETARKNLSSIINNESRQHRDTPSLSSKAKIEKYVDVDHEYSMNEGRTGSQKRTLRGRKSVAVSFPTQLLAHVPLLQDRRKTWQHLEAPAKEECFRPGLSSNKDGQKSQSMKTPIRTRNAEPTSLNTQEKSFINECIRSHERIKETFSQTADRPKCNPEVAIAVTSPSHCQDGAVVTAAGSPGVIADVTFYLSELSEFSVNQTDERGVNHYVDDKEVVFYQKVPVRPFEVSTGELVRVIQDAKPEEFYWEDIRHLVIDNKELNSLYNLDDFCHQLQTLSAAQNSLRQLAGAPPSIRQLDASRNQLSSLTTWAHLTNLQYLNVSGNNIDSLSGFGELIHLRELRADNNQIASLDGILTLDALIKLNLRSNRLSELDFTSSNL